MFGTVSVPSALEFARYDAILRIDCVILPSGAHSLEPSLLQSEFKLSDAIGPCPFALRDGSKRRFSRQRRYRT